MQIFYYLLSCSQHYYVVDTQIYVKYLIDSVQVIIYDLQKLSIYSEEHCLKLNGAKTTAIAFGSKAYRNIFFDTFGSPLHINNNIIEFRDSVRNLSLHIDDDLRFTYHINKSFQKAYVNIKLNRITY